MPDKVSQHALGGPAIPPNPPRRRHTFKIATAWLLAVETLFAVGALRMAGTPDDDPAIRKALAFLSRCQNLTEEGPEGDPAFDDGGFFFTPTDPVRNKAGVAGNDRRGQVRYHSYGSATADGLRALLRCGLSPGDRRVVAARPAG